jgi:hypothetical protein
LNLKELQQYFIDRVEATSGKHVLLQSDPKFTGHATIRVAKDKQPDHVLLYKPAHETVLPYLVAFQCEFALRTILAEPESQFNLISKLFSDGAFLFLSQPYPGRRFALPWAISFCPFGAGTS